VIALWAKGILGQNLALRMLDSAMSREMLSQSYIFSGPSGVGRKLTALRLAMAIQCEEGYGSGCGQCTSCQKLLRGTHPDWHLLEPDGVNIRIDQIRELHVTISRRPHQGRRRIAVIDPAEKMNEPSANALLKLLEEPPADSLLVLISSNPLQLLPTIRSRCQTIRFNPLSLSDLSAFLPESTPEAKRMTVLRCAGGSVGKLLSLTEDEDWDEGRHQGVAWYLEEPSWNLSQRMKFSEERDEQWRNRLPWQEMLRDWQSLTRDRLMMEHGIRENGVWNPDVAENLRRMPGLSPKQLMLRVVQLDEAMGQIESNTPPRLVAESLLLSWIGS